MYNDRQDRQYRQDHSDSNGFDEICTDNNDDNNDSMEHTGDENIVETNILRPGFECYLRPYKISDELYQPGVYYHTFSKGVPVDIRISSPLIIKYATCDHNNNNQGRVISLIDPQGNQHELTMPMHVLKGSGEELLGELLSRGLLYYRRHKNLLLDYIMNSVPKKTILAVSKTGWYASNIFILHNKVIGAKDVIFQSDHIVESHFSVSGTVESWINAIGTKCVDNIPLMISVALALAGPVFGKLNILSTGGIHWYGDSSLGKTTAALVAASIYGDHKFINSWNSTKNGIEGLALCRNDTLIILDEIDEANAQDVGANVYQIFNGQGKQRANKLGNARDVNKWRTPVISTGERSLINVMNEAKIPPNAGHLIRMLNVEANFKFGIFNNLHGFASGKDLSNFLKEQTQFHYGAIGPEFIEHLIKEQDITPRFIEIHNMLECLGKNNLEQRVLSFLSVVTLAGELGINMVCFRGIRNIWLMLPQKSLYVGKIAIYLIRLKTNV